MTLNEILIIAGIILIAVVFIYARFFARGEYDNERNGSIE